MIVFDENVHQQRIMASVAAWYRGRVLSITALRPGTLIADEAIPAILRRVSQPTFVTTNVEDFWRRVPADPRYGIMCVVLPSERLLEEIIRGRLQVIRQAEAGTARVDLPRAYTLFEQTIRDVQRYTILAYTPQADLHYRQWRQERLRISTHDLWIAAICVTHTARLISRNRRDFEQVPGLLVEFWG